MIIGISGKIGSGKDTVGKIIQYLTTPSEIYSLQDWLDSDDINGRDFNWKIKKFAGKLKEVVSLLTGYSLEDLEKQEIKDTVLGKEWWYYKIPNQDGSYSIRNIKNAGNYAKDNYRVFKPTVRDLLQQVGTDAMRNVVHPNIWVNALMSNYYPTGKFRWAKSIGDLHYGAGNNTLCGKPMLGNNYANHLIDGERNICPDCYDKSLPNWVITDVRFENEAQAVLDKGGILIRIERMPGQLLGKAVTKKEGGNGEYIIDEHCICDVPIPKEHYGKVISTQDFKIAYPFYSEHPSETALDNYKGFKYIIHNNKSIDDLIISVRQILLSEGIL